MGNPKSKPKREAEVAPKVKINSPTSIETSTGFHLLEFHGPTVSNIVILGAFACFTALGVVFLYRHLSKKRRRKEARLLQSPWSPAGPHPGAAHNVGANHDVLPFIMAMARRHKEQEFQRGASRMTDLMEEIQPAPRPATVHSLSELRKAASYKAADEIDAVSYTHLTLPTIYSV